jgi:putative colanic acid biosynthesis acetyltransferase WcaF
MEQLHRHFPVWAPWMLRLGKYDYIDENVNLYNAYGIDIGDRVVISQNSFLCTASHDYTVSGYSIIGAPITIMND